MILKDKLETHPDLCMIFHWFNEPRGGMLDHVATAENLERAKRGAVAVPGWVQVLDFSTDILHIRDPDGVWTEKLPDEKIPVAAVLLANKKTFPRTNKQTQHDR